ncbi:MAG: right-handed parallel beta-helix repeat-containing protein [Sedimentisphaerales bacterium]|nr:right-handed parallel beta-helix repeat-containing protein [Sedimentisphaerales bacterium]
MLASGAAYGRDFYVSPGRNGGDGSFDTPFRMIEAGVQAAQPGDTVFLRGGVYCCPDTIRIDKSGAPDLSITLRAFGDEPVVLDFFRVGADERGLHLKGDYWHVEGLTIQHAGDNGIIVYGAYNVLDRLVARANGDSGIQLHTGAAHNLVLNCDSYANYDADNHGENADGFAAKFSLGEGNAFAGCRSWGNSDDGYDFWEAGNGVTLTNCWASRNGINVWDDPAYAGDGNGFKLGHGSGAHVLIRCVAYDHPYHGIDVNGNLTGVLVYNCSCVMNQGRDFYFDEHSDAHVLRNNVSYPRSVVIYDEIDDERNSWNSAPVGEPDFASLDPNGIDGPRRADGGLPALAFLRPASVSCLIDAGIDMGLPFEGTAPDLGAFEHLAGDCVPDGCIDIADLRCFASNWLTVNGRIRCRADFNRNGLVDLHDFATLASNWLKR